MDSWNIIGWALIILSVVLALVWFVGVLRRAIPQWRATRKHRRAHAGKVQCESREGDKCQRVAIKVTPHGYFCSEHWLQNVRVKTLYGGYSWSHDLEHAVKGRK